MSSDDDEESDDEILEFKDDGIDYAKLWDEKSIKPQSTELNEIKIFSAHGKTWSTQPLEW